MRKVIGKTVQVALTLILGILLLCNLSLLFMERVMGVEHPTLFGFSTAVIVSGSMEPSLAVDDLIFNCAQKEYQVGDIITFQSGDALVTHRIIGVESGIFLTQGDANNAPDPQGVVPEQILGQVVGRIPRMGSLIGFLRTPLGGILLILLGVLLIEVPQLLRRWGEHTNREGRHYEI